MEYLFKVRMLYTYRILVAFLERLLQVIWYFAIYRVPKPNLSLHSPYYAEACNEFAVPISAT